jgi:hypothetical protein
MEVRGIKDRMAEALRYYGFYIFRVTDLREVSAVLAKLRSRQFMRIRKLDREGLLRILEPDPGAYVQKCAEMCRKGAVLDTMCLADCKDRERRGIIKTVLEEMGYET